MYTSIAAGVYTVDEHTLDFISVMITQIFNFKIFHIHCSRL